MKLKNTLGLAIGSLVAATSFGALAQGQGAVEGELFTKKYYTDSSRDLDNGNLYGGSVGYFLTDDVELRLGYDGIHNMRSKNDTGNQKIHGGDTALDALYHFGTPGVGLRPYVSAGFSHQSISNVQANGHSGRDSSTFFNAGAGAKYYFTENVYARAGVEAMYNIDRGETEWAPSVGVGVNFGGGAKKAAPAPVAAPVADACTDADQDGVCDNVDKCPNTPANTAVDADGCPAVAQTVRVELDVKFDFDKAVVKPNSYADIKNLADFMKQYPQTTTTVEGHTDSVGTDAYNQKLSEKRAAAVRNVLVNQYGVQGSRVNSVGYGESRPVADNATEAGRAVNRRVEANVEAQAK
ncbi:MULTISPECIES: OmpA family protein [unclassified Pseudomonas]|uniref:OmpA family protein n=1 Tax=unclassified Pseudomonas TaxID=196821 RepID=UPI000BDB54BC|nr:MULTISPECIES: OmpA family protein [unclassified Pseudomonas]PVZ13602.1 OOP family OmpA-OmpF porin [Pseudomonas sp. URIL14HWK12:I12]PVZ23908.1 OOP family OmpA-OmpF porin [Pseudomonas sp. URIL14HWK12:I10]PVZ33453.1 OOP family OmpA-OmpF porin [Pseudomonas sp. URIL14HWK12:I11]SNZ11615.1 OmpA-OmpF porin, OOP family [Pseudomonas sp. URIL14HWK12:I9]